MFARVVPQGVARHARTVGLAMTLAAGAMVLTGNQAGATGAPTYVPGTPVVDSITNGTTAAPWNESQGDPAFPAYASQSPGTLLPTYTPGGAQTTGTGVPTEPNVAVYPSATSGTDGVAALPEWHRGHARSP